MQRKAHWLTPAIFFILLVLGVLINSPLFSEVYEWAVRTVSDKNTGHYLAQAGRNRILLTSLLAAIALCLFQVDRIIRNKQLIIKAVILVQLVLVVIYGLNASFQKDGFEHLHSSWNVLNGEVPFVDFFQHHHPLLWYVHAPVIGVLGGGTPAVWFIRLECFFVILGFLWVIWKTGKLLGFDSFERFFTLSVFLSQAGLIKSLFVFRPDLLQTFFCLLSVLFFLRFLQSKSDRHLIISAILWSVGFLFLQKALFVLAPMGLALIYQVISRATKFRSVVLFTLSAVLLPLILAGLYLLSGSFGDYLVFNWIVNFYKQTSFQWWQIFTSTTMLTLNYAGYWLIIPGIVLFIMNWKSKLANAKMVLWIGLVSFTLIAMTPRPYLQYYYCCIVLLSIFSSEILRRKWSLPVKRLAVSMGIPLLLSPLVLACLSKQKPDSFREGLALIRLVNEHSLPDDYVWDSQPGGATFRPDMHYFWYHYKMEGVTNNYTHYQSILESGKYGHLPGDPKSDFDFCDLIQEKKPVLFIQREEAYYNLRSCEGLTDEYQVISEKPLVYKRIK